MPDLTITPADVLTTGQARQATVATGQTIQAGQMIYLDAGNATLASATAEASAAVAGMALNSASEGQPLSYLQRGTVTIGTGVQGQIYVLSPLTPGNINDQTDLTTGNYVVYLGVVNDQQQLLLNTHITGVQLP